MMSDKESEPVAVVSGYYGGHCVILPLDPARVFSANTALYAAPQREWVGLTDDEMLMIYAQPHEGFKYSLGRMIQAKLKEKNT